MMRDGEEYIEIEGTKHKVIEEIMQVCSLDREISEKSLDFIKNEREILSDEEFFQYSRLEEYEIDGASEFVSEKGQFYISLRKSTIFLACLYLGIKVPEFGIIKGVIDFFNIGNIEGGFTQLNEKKGNLCIILELARNRRHGAGKALLKKFNGECCNNQLNCQYNEKGLCNCKEWMVEEICEDLVRRGIVKKRGKKYFYDL